jgi:hypothetical protein
LNQLVGEVVFDSPPFTTCSAYASETSENTQGAVYILLDGAVIGVARSWAQEIARSGVHSIIEWGREPRYNPPSFPPYFGLASMTTNALFESGIDTPHAMTAEIADDCGAKGGHTGGHFTIDSVTIDVVGAR